MKPLQAFHVAEQLLTMFIHSLTRDWSVSDHVNNLPQIDNELPLFS